MSIIKKLPFRRDITHLTLYSINICGVFPITNQANLFVRYIWICFATYAMLYMCGSSIVEPFLKDYDFNVKVSIVLNVLTSLVCYCNPIILLYCRKTILKMLPLIDEGFFIYPDEHLFQVITDTYFDK